MTAVPTNILLQFTMTAQLLNGQGPNAFEPVYWDVYNVPDMTGALSGYQGNLQNISIAAVTQIASPTSNLVIPTGPAGGDLSGNYPNPLIKSIQGNPVSLGTLGPSQDGYVMYWNGTDLIMQPSSAGVAGGDLSGSYPNPKVIALQGNAVSSQVLSSLQDGYALTWNGTEWQASLVAAMFTAGNDLSGTNGDQTVIGLYNHPLSSTAPVQSAVPIWDVSASKYDIRQITQDDIGAGFVITGFSGGSTVEVGATVSNPSFTASYNRTPASASISNTDGLDSPLALSSPFTSGTVIASFHHTAQATVSFTLTAIGSSTQTAGQAISFLPRSFGGVGAGGAVSATASGTSADLNNGVVLTNLGLFSSDTGQTFGPFSPSAQKIYLLLVGGSHTFKDAETGFAFPFLTPTSVSFTNINSAVIAMYLYESSNILSASYTLTVVT